MVVPFAGAVPAGTGPGADVGDEGTDLDRLLGDRGPDAPAALSPVPGAGPASPDLQRNLDLAQRLLADEDASPLTRTLERTRTASHWQADSLELAWEDRDLAPDHDRPSEAVLALLERHDATPAPAERSTVRALDELPADVAGALADLVDAFVGLERAAVLAYADADPAALEELSALEPREILDERSSPSAGERLQNAGVDLAPVYPARNALLDAVGDLGRAVDAHPALAAGSGPLVDQAPVVVVDADPGRESLHDEDAALLVDLGGADTYHNNAGGSSLTNPPTDDLSTDPCDVPATDAIENPPPAAHGAAALVDLGEADDRYGDPAAPGSCGRNGGGHLGVGLLVDAGGDDDYRLGNDATVGDCRSCGVGSFGVNGGGEIGGAGLLVDATGNDSYVAGTHSVVTTCPNDCDAGGTGVNGGAAVASGLLVDGGGDDRYEAGTGSVVRSCEGSNCHTGGGGVNGGANLGSGALVDAGGDDLYLAGNDVTIEACEGSLCGVVGVGVNGGGMAGQGLVVDGGGNDVYRAGTGSEILACGAGGCGMGSFGSNGGGVAGSGSIVDGGGNDVYLAGTDVHVQSCAADCPAGSVGANGGTANGEALLADAGGDDVYLAGTGTVVDACPNGGCDVGQTGVNGGAVVGLSALLDGGGADRYDDDMGGSGTDRTVVPKGFLGAQVDVGVP